MIINDYIDKVRYQSGNVYTYVFYIVRKYRYFAEITEIVKRSIIRYVTIERQFLKQINVFENL